MSGDTPPELDELPVVVAGAGPVGLTAAAHLLDRGLEPVVVETGPSAATSVREWGHVRLFSPWEWVIDPVAEKLLTSHGWEPPQPGVYPTGAEWVDGYLEPLAAALGDRVRTNTTVTGVARRGRDRVVDEGRRTEPLTVHVRTPQGTRRIAARGLVDASGTWATPNPLGGDGLPALGEPEAADRITTHIPDPTTRAWTDRYAGRHIAVAGSGHSALTAIVALAALAVVEPGTRVSWLLRRGTLGQVFGGGSGDALPERGALGTRASAAIVAGAVRPVFSFRTARVDTGPDGRLTLTSEDGTTVSDVDEVIVLTGFRPDLGWLSEVRLELDATLQAPTRLAPLIDPNVHSCGTVYPHGAVELAHPEPGVFLAGMKSYGRAPTFLARTGYEQVRSIAAALAGDHEAAARVELVLADTGVCGGAGLFDEEISAEESEPGPAPDGLLTVAVARPDNGCCSG